MSGKGAAGTVADARKRNLRKVRVSSRPRRATNPLRGRFRVAPRSHCSGIHTTARARARPCPQPEPRARAAALFSESPGSEFKAQGSEFAASKGSVGFRNHDAGRRICEIVPVVGGNTDPAGLAFASSGKPVSLGGRPRQGPRESYLNRLAKRDVFELIQVTVSGIADVGEGNYVLLGWTERRRIDPPRGLGDLSAIPLLLENA
ncbi:uncharacterized protein [Dermacentor andersoni]|uniref:uncharacterized protein n=1 Tax=Dermacentor andersoni TaxID=34620 RepID=UPI002415A472|nr:uncharacterized protein LOC129381746 [Dermacentor andersoni]